MAWCRIHDGAMTHPKVAGMTDKGFRLWVWGLAHSQQHLTDGLIAADAIPKRLARAARELLSRRLWEAHDVGFKVHDYLDWNDSRETVIAKRSGAKNRLQRWSDKRVANATSEHDSRITGVGKSSVEREDEEIYQRAGRLREERYPAWYAQHRHGARLRLVASPVEFQEAITLCKTWDDARLEKLAAIFLTTDDDWISQTDRGFRVFAARASWCDDRLTQWEREHGKAASA